MKVYLVSEEIEVESAVIPWFRPVKGLFGKNNQGLLYNYHGLKIHLWINNISLRAYYEITYTGGIGKIKTSFDDIVGDSLVVTKDDFLKNFVTERDYIREMVSTGEVLRMGIGSENARLLYTRLVPLVRLFVEGSVSIDVKDTNWDLNLLIRKKEEKEGPLYRIVGFASIYKVFHNDRIRMRLRQILVLPSFQGQGLGSYLMHEINNVAVTEDVYDLTVEKPSEKKQFLKCWEILIYLALDPRDKYMEDYTSVITNHVRSDKPDQEQELKQLVEERIREIKLVAEKLY